MSTHVLCTNLRLPVECIPLGVVDLNSMSHVKKAIWSEVPIADWPIPSDPLTVQAPVHSAQREGTSPDAGSGGHQKSMRFGDWITRVSDVGGDRKALRIVKLAVTGNAVAFREQQQFLIY